MNTKTYEDHYKTFLSEFHRLAKHKHRFEVFRDFVTLSALSLSNAVHMNQEREAEYHEIRKSYSKEDMDVFAKLLGLLVQILDKQPHDALGELFMRLEIASKDKGQFFTPSSVSDLMAQITYGSELDDLKKPFITLSEPACGAGGMVLSFVKLMIEKGHNPADRMWTQCIDVDRLAGLMCFVQLSLWNVPAEILIGDTLRWDIREVWRTPQHHLGLWSHKMAREPKTTAKDSPKQEVHTSRPTEVREESSQEQTQFDFAF